MCQKRILYQTQQSYVFSLFCHSLVSQTGIQYYSGSRQPESLHACSYTSLKSRFSTPVDLQFPLMAEPATGLDLGISDLDLSNDPTQHQQSALMTNDPRMCLCPSVVEKSLVGSGGKSPGSA